MTSPTIEELEKQIFELGQQLQSLRKDSAGTEVENYTFDTIDGSITLQQLFAGNDKLLAIHNMGQGCRYCTLWGDGLNPFIPHLESAMSVVMLSKDDPQTQRLFANSRNWRFRLASHESSNYLKEQTTMAGVDNMPGVVCYELRDNKIYRTNAACFGPGDQYCSIWHLLGLAGLAEAWTPQYNYWQRPAKLDDGGENLLG